MLILQLLNPQNYSQRNKLKRHYFRGLNAWITFILQLFPIRHTLRITIRTSIDRPVVCHPTSFFLSPSLFICGLAFFSRKKTFFSWWKKRGWNTQSHGSDGKTCHKMYWAPNKLCYLIPEDRGRNCNYQNEAKVENCGRGANRYF